ncbi:MAG: DNA polymerase III subunit psi [Colwellia sp.]
MSISQRQFNQLNEMGIGLWQQRVPKSETESINGHTNVINIDLNKLSQNPLFSDIILSAGITLGEVVVQTDHLNLGLFDWYFYESQNTELHCSNNKLFTPNINIIAKSPHLKKQLWQVIESQIL